jgi:DNA-directed RNA polymerase alpha subunit
MIKATQTTPPQTVESAKPPGAIYQTSGQLRDATTLQKRREGKTLAAIGAEMGVSVERVRQMVAKAERRESAVSNETASPLDLLSVRAQNCLRGASSCLGYTPTPQEIRAQMDSGQLKKIDNMGKKTIQEISDWLAAIKA